MNLLRNLASFARMLADELLLALQPAPIEVATVVPLRQQAAVELEEESVGG